jgi:hypothetical protein
MAPWSFIAMKISFIKSRFTLIAAFLIIGGLGGSSYFGYKLAHSQTIPEPKNSARVTPQNTIAAYSASQPTRLIIPKIGVNAPSIRTFNLKQTARLKPLILQPMLAGTVILLLLAKLARP